MSDVSSRNLRIESQALGRILIQPSERNADDFEQARLLFFPHRMNEAQFDLASEFGASTQIPIYCLERDRRKLISHGFGSYRFQSLDGYREIELGRAVLEFFPFRGGVRNRWLAPVFFEIFEKLKLRPIQAFHVFAKIRGEKSFLYLASDEVSSNDWELLAPLKADIVVGSPFSPAYAWHALSPFLGQKIIPAEKFSRLSTGSVDVDNSRLELEESSAWQKDTGL